MEALEGIDWPGTITAIATLVAAVGALFLSYRNHRKAERAAKAAETAAIAARAAATDIIATKDGVFEVGKQLDGRLSELLDLTRRVAFAEGRSAQRENHLGESTETASDS